MLRERETERETQRETQRERQRQRQRQREKERQGAKSVCYVKGRLFLLIPSSTFSQNIELLIILSPLK